MGPPQPVSDRDRSQRRVRPLLHQRRRPEHLRGGQPGCGGQLRLADAGGAVPAGQRPGRAQAPPAGLIDPIDVVRARRGQLRHRRRVHPRRALAERLRRHLLLRRRRLGTDLDSPAERQRRLRRTVRHRRVRHHRHDVRLRRRRRDGPVLRAGRRLAPDDLRDRPGRTGRTIRSSHAADHPDPCLRHGRRHGRPRGRDRSSVQRHDARGRSRSAGCVSRRPGQHHGCRDGRIGLRSHLGIACASAGDLIGERRRVDDGGQRGDRAVGRRRHVRARDRNDDTGRRRRDGLVRSHRRNQRRRSLDRARPPARLADTRETAGTLLDSGSTNPWSRSGNRIDLDVAGFVGVPDDATVQAVVLSVAAIARPAQQGRVALVPRGAPDSGTASVNVTGGDIRNNVVVVPLDRGAVSAITKNLDDIVVDVLGYVTSTSAVEGSLASTPRSPRRGWSTPGFHAASAGSPRRHLRWSRCRADRVLPPWRRTITVTNTSGPGWIVAHPSVDPPVVSNLNYRAAGQTRGTWRSPSSPTPAGNGSPLASPPMSSSTWSGSSPTSSLTAHAGGVPPDSPSTPRSSTVTAAVPDTVATLTP